MLFQKLIDRLFFGNLDAERDSATRHIVARYSRGNVAVQGERYLSKKGFTKLQARGDDAFARLMANVPNSTK